MQLSTRDIRNGKHTGETVWICHYHQPDLYKKPLRNLAPTQVMVISNDELPANKTVYYSDNHFLPLSKDGKPLKKVISPVDNTGFRSRCGNELFVFTTEHECVSEWNKQLRYHAEQLDIRIAEAAREWTDKRDTLLSKIK